MISLNNLTTDVQRLKKRIEDKMKHAFLDKYIVPQEIDEEKIVILSKMIPMNSLPGLKRETYIVTTMLVQVALDTHESVPADNNTGEDQAPDLETQLKVLAGDYYSGLYYYLLSEIDDLLFIRKLAAAIKEINEYKMRLYYHEYASFEEYIDLKMHVKALLLYRVSEHLNNPAMNEMIKEWAYINILLTEKQTKYQGNTQCINRFKKFTKDPLTYNKKLDYELNNHLLLFEKEVKGLPESYDELKTYFTDRLNHRIYIHTSIAEEG